MLFGGYYKALSIVPIIIRQTKHRGYKWDRNRHDTKRLYKVLVIILFYVRVRDFD